MNQVFPIVALIHFIAMLESAVNAQEIHIRVLDAQNGKGITQQMGQRDQQSCSEQEAG
jgi:hypothetical protein